MLALSPPLFSTTYGWPNPQQDCNDIFTEFEANSYSSLLDFHTYNQIHHDVALENTNSNSNSNSNSFEGGLDENIGDPMKVAKNLNHNASERDRRKRVNELYVFLRSLLPMSTDQKKKVSIPHTLWRALKYIPELQKEVDVLIRKKVKLSSYPSTTASTSQDYPIIKKRSAIIDRKSSLNSMVTVLGEKEVVIQLMFSTQHMSKNKDVGFLPKVLDYFEHEEDGFVLLNLSTFIGSGEGMSLNTLHLQAQGDKKIDVEKLKEKLCSLY